MKVRLLSTVVGQDQFVGTVAAVAVEPTGWRLCGILVEPGHRLGLGKWVPPDLVRSDGRDGLRMQLAPSGFEDLDDAESSSLEEGVRSNYTPYGLPSPAVLRRTVKEMAPPGATIVNAKTPIRGLDWDGVTFGGVVTAGKDQIQQLLVLRKRLIGRSEHELLTRSATLTTDGIRVAGPPKAG